jgi:hypothetical protein
VLGRRGSSSATPSAAPRLLENPALRPPGSQDHNSRSKVLAQHQEGEELRLSKAVMGSPAAMRRNASSSDGQNLTCKLHR